MTNLEYVRELLDGDGPNWVVEQLAEELDQRDARIAELKKRCEDLHQRLKNWNCGANSCTVYAHEERIKELEQKCVELTEKYGQCLHQRDQLEAENTRTCNSVSKTGTTGPSMTHK